MEMTKKFFDTRRRLFAVAIFFGVNAATAQAVAAQTEYLYTNETPTVELNFFDAGEFTSNYNFNNALRNAARSSTGYWKNLLNPLTDATPWQLVFTRNDSRLSVQNFSFSNGALVQENYPEQMFKGMRTLTPYDAQRLIDGTLTDGAAQDGNSAVTVVNVGAGEDSDLVGALRLEMAHAFGVQVPLDSTGKKFSYLNDWTAHLIDSNGFGAEAGKQIVTGAEFAAMLENNPELSAENFFVADKVFFVGQNVSEVLDGATFDGVAGIPLSAWRGKDFDGVRTLLPGLMSASGYKNYSIFTELELAALQDIGYNIDRKKFFGHSIYNSGINFTNSEDFTGATPLAVGLHIAGSDNVVTQRGNINLTGEGAVGVRVDGNGNRLNIHRDAIIKSDGTGGVGVLISSGGEHNLDIAGTISAERALYINSNAFVRNININGAQLFGDIISNYGGNFTALNFNANTNFGGNISGADNFRLNVTGGTLNFAGAANVISVDVASGAKIFGGNFTVNAGDFVNHGTIGAGSADTNLIINGNLVSDGILQKISGGGEGTIIVNGRANIDGSTVTTDSLLPNETALVLRANSITGKIKNSVGNPVPISAMLNATGRVVGNRLFVTTYEASNFDKLNSQQSKTLNAMLNMYDTLDGSGKRNEMREFYNLNPDDTKRTLKEISSDDAAQVMSVAQQSNVVDRMISDRISKVLPDAALGTLDVVVRPAFFADGDDTAPTVNVKVQTPARQENNFWLNFMKNWGSLRGGTDYHGSAIVGGYDRAVNKNWRVGIFATYGTLGYGAESARASVYDTRLGLYTGYHNRSSDVYLYVNGGQLRNKLHRGLSPLGLSTSANYKSRIVEVGGEYKYDLSPKKIWHVSPFVNFQASHLRQNSYNESGAGIYNQHVDALSNNYFAAQIGLDLKRYYDNGMFGFRFGVKHGFTGADPDLKISYEGDGSRSYRLRNKRDKTHGLFSVRGDNEFSDGWFVGGEAEIQFSEHDKDFTASLMLRRIW